ncbi:hypothetical protein SAMN05192574_102278 [Mucilaginibacter gossypiicola]|uniref:Uncharacterized protein n=1 Tax=Mucilaginibacter gossypiicola TaxID=551995 RepID=A0A1H8DAU3_9SPHI|nr:hypothetical protein [Mucilaginibacter gossypiicola]SEN04379.1 hypothetical protein SAMN05192574_102278 [Mucilaginibacter gossypiicola]
MKNLTRIYTNPLVNNTPGFQDVRNLVQGVIASKGQKGRVLLVTGQKQQTEIVEKLVNGKFSKTKPTPFPGTKVFTVHQAINSIRSVEQEAFVSLGLSSDELLALESEINSDFMIVAPWYDGSVDKWAKITGAIAYPAQTVATPYPPVSCLLEQALLNLQSIGDEASHPGDRSLIKTVFTVVLENNISTNADEMEAYLFAKSGWSKRKIDKVLDILNTLKSGGQTRDALLDNRPQMYDRWQKACEPDTTLAHKIKK